MSIRIETERLLIREIMPSDEAGMFEMDSDPEVHKYITKTPLKTMDEVRDVIAFVRKQYVDNGIGRWAVEEKETGEFLGWTGFKLMNEVTNGRVGHYDFGYRFKRKVWGRGIATEAGKASLKYGIEVLKLDPVFAMTDVDHVVSRHILEQLGFRFVEIFRYDTPGYWRTENNMEATWYEWK